MKIGGQKLTLFHHLSDLFFCDAASKTFEALTVLKTGFFFADTVTFVDQFSDLVRKCIRRNYMIINSFFRRRLITENRTASERFRRYFCVFHGSTLFLLFSDDTAVRCDSVSFFVNY